MRPIPPRIVLPVSECSKGVRVQGQVVGAKVVIFAGPVQVGDGIATSADQTFPLGVPLVAGQQLRAQQIINQDASDQSPDAIVVLPAPQNASDLPPLSALTHLYRCGTMLYADGAFPGAQVTVSVGGIARGSSMSNDGTVQVPLAPAIGPQDHLVITQSACSADGQPATLPLPDQPPLVSGKLAAPTIRGSLFDCQSQIALDGIVDGATVHVLRASGEEVAVCGVAAESLNLMHPLVAGEAIVVFQTLRTCEADGIHSAPVVVGPPNLPAPTLLGPICQRDRSVRVEGLMPGAQVRFYADGQTFAYGQAWSDSCDFPMPDLFGVSTLSVQQALCSPEQWSNLSVGINLDSSPTVDLDPSIVSPIVDCGRVVRVVGVAPGVNVYIYSRKWNGPIGFARADDYQVDVPLALPLITDDKVYARMSQCGEPGESPDEVVQPPLRPEPPTVSDPVYDCGGSISVANASPGARVEVYVNHLFAGSAIGPLSTSSVPIARPLQNGDVVNARQYVCGQMTDFGNLVQFKAGSDVEYVVGSIERICQLTGNHDPEGKAHINQTGQWGVVGTDLGISVDHGDRTYFFFGDQGSASNQSDQTDEDPIAYTTESVAEPHGFHLTFIQKGAGDVSFRRLTVSGLTPLGNFEVPTGAFSFDGRLYVFVAKSGADVMERSYLASASDPSTDFALVYSDPIDSIDTAPDGVLKFINISAAVVNNSDWPGLPSATGTGLLLWGSGSYRQSNVYLAWVPLTPGAPPPPRSEWRFYSGPGPQWTAPGNLGGAQPVFFDPVRPSVGEISVAYVDQLRRWVLLYGGVSGASAKAPFGDWISFDDPIFSASRDGALGKYMHLPGADDLDKGEDGGSDPGEAYGAYIINRMTKWDADRRVATIYFTMSTHVPYNVMLMKCELQCD